MHIILGGNGHIGTALARVLLSQGEDVTIVSRNFFCKPKWEKLGARVAVVDVHETSKLKSVFKLGKRLFLLNPPADLSTDIDKEERKSLTSILNAIKDSGLQKIVAESTYGAQQGEQIGDLGVLYEMEQGLKAQSIPYSIIRAAYYMSNWDLSLQTAQKECILHTFFPPDFSLPMVAPQDIGKFAACLMTEPAENTGIYHFEGPKQYSSLDVAKAFSNALDRTVEIAEIPPNQWQPTMKNIGFSEKAAKSFANMTKITIENNFPKREDVISGTISLSSYVSKLVKNS